MKQVRFIYPRHWKAFENQAKATENEKEKQIKAIRELREKQKKYLKNN